MGVSSNNTSSIFNEVVIFDDVNTGSTTPALAPPCPLCSYTKSSLLHQQQERHGAQSIQLQSHQGGATCWLRRQMDSAERVGQEP
jgi:hypothetical protein